MNQELEKSITDFASKVRPIYLLLEWDWHDKGVPTVEQIAKGIARHIENVEKEGLLESSSGGIFVRRSCEEESQLSFGIDIHGGSFFTTSKAQKYD